MPLLSNPDLNKAENEAITFLDAQFQTVDQLQLDDLLQQVRHRHEELQANLSVSQREIETLVSNTRTEAETHLQLAQELSLQRHGIVDNLTELSQQLVSDMTLEERQPTLLEDIETLHRNLKELTSIRSYVRVIEHALSLSESALKQVQYCTTPLNSACISEYRELQAFVSKVRDFCQKSCDISFEQQSLHLVTFLESLESKTWTDIKTVLFNVLLATAEKFGWPLPVNYATVSTNDRVVFENAFRNLLELQKQAGKIGVPTNENDGLYPLQALVQPIFLRFKYHFEGSRQTNRLDKPEWYFTHVQNLAHDHRPFMEKVIQALLSSTDYASIDAWREFVLLLLPMLARKMKRTIPSLLPHPPLLAQTIYQALVFDTAMREEGFELERTSAQRTEKESVESETWTGISEVILGNEEWFDAWLKGENRFADEQYHDIISAPDAWVVDDDDGVDSQDFKPTISARKLKALFEQITDRYSPLPHTGHRARFLTTVQLPILDLYNRRIVSSLDAYETYSSVFVRAVPGALTASFSGKEGGSINIDTHKLTAGVDGVQRLCKAFLSAAFLESALEGWGEELFFLDLWTQMNSDPALQAEKSSLLPKVAFDKDTAPTNTVFDNLISRYTKAIVRAEDMIVQQVCVEVEGHLKAHLVALTADDTDQANDMAISQTLLVPIALLSSHLTFIRSTLPQTALITLYRQIASRLAEHILQRQILHRGQLSLAQAKVVAAECELWVETCHVALAGRLSSGRYRVESPWLRLLQVGRLVSLEGEEWLAVRNSISRQISDEAWTQLMTRLVGISELDKGEVATVVQRREDF